MTFRRPYNEEKLIKALVDQYENKFSKFDPNTWLAAAFQKDAIQNSWDARRDKGSGRGWTSNLFFRNLSSTGLRGSYIGIVDTGTYGLTGEIPHGRDEEIEEQVAAIAEKAVKEKDPNERLALFLSSYWSEKGEAGIGSRGMGKNIFLGCSESQTIYFDSLRFTDRKYIFGKVFMNRDVKRVEQEFFIGEDAESARVEIFKDAFSSLEEPGTRIIIEDPRPELVAGFVEAKLIEHIQYTWWEVLDKFAAKIKVDNDGEETLVKPNPFLPLDKLRIEVTEILEEVPLQGYPNLKIERITLCYLGEKRVPEWYLGVAIQRKGMTVETLPAVLMDRYLAREEAASRIVGTVQMGGNLEEVMESFEDPQHTSFNWSKGVAKVFRKILASELKKFMDKHELVKRSKETEATEKTKEISRQIEEEINDYYERKLRLPLEGTGKDRKKKKRKKKLGEVLPIRLSVADFKLPGDNLRVNRGQVIEKAYAIPVYDFTEPFKVLVSVSVKRVLPELGSSREEESEYTKKEVEEMVTLPTPKGFWVGWEELLVDAGYEKGRYQFVAELVALEDKGDYKIKKGKEFKAVERTDVLHRVIKPFFVEQDPPQSGRFRVEPSPADNPSKLYWWREEEDEMTGTIVWFVRWNPDHPMFVSVGDEKARDLKVRAIVFQAMFSIIFGEDKDRLASGERPLVFDKQTLEGEDLDAAVQSIIEMQSQALWDILS